MATVLKFAGDPETTLSILLFKDVTNGGQACRAAALRFH